VSVQDYAVGFPFKGQDGAFYGPNGSIGLYHLGDDLYTPTGTAFIILGTLLGYTGATGRVGGPHIHLAKWKSGNVASGYFVPRYNRSYFKPTPSVFQVPGKVIELSNQNIGDAGKFIRWQADDGYTYEGFHLSQVLVSVGDLIGKGESMIDETTCRWIIEQTTGRGPVANELADRVGKYSPAYVINEYVNSAAGKDFRARQAKEHADKDAIINKLTNQLDGKGTTLSPGLYVVK